MYLLTAIHCKDGKILDTRYFGLYTEDQIDELRDIVINNVTDLWEFYYRYMAIVKIPENTLYVDIYRELFELYEVSLPKECYGKSTREVNEILKEKFNEVKFNLVKKEDIPQYISQAYRGLILTEEGEMSVSD